jgi:hypothetical protein
VRGADELAELIEVLEQKPKATRDRYIGAAARTNQSLHIVVASSWLAEVKRLGFDARATAALYHKLSRTLTAQENPDLAVELCCAEAIMLDEYANDQGNSLEVLRIAQETYPNDYRLNRQRQKVFYRNQQHTEALAEFEKFRSRMPTERVLDRAYALREAGRSAAEVGDIDQTRMFFEEAWEASRLCGRAMQPMTSGLSADCAILDFDAGQVESALNLMRRALLEADDLDPRAGLKESYVKRIHLAAILYMRGAAADFPAARQAKVIGMCSDPAPQEWFRLQPQPHPLLAWYQLAELEAESSRSQSVLEELRKRTKSGSLLSMEVVLVSRITEAAIRELDVDRFLDALTIYPRAVVEGTYILRDRGGAHFLNPPVGRLAAITEDEWKTGTVAESAKRAVLSFMLVCAAHSRGDVMIEFRRKIACIPGLAEVVDDLFQFIDRPTLEESDVYVIISSIVGRLLRGDKFDVSDVFLSAVYTLQLLENSVTASAVAAAMISFYERIWIDILDRRSFSMRNPATNGPYISNAMAQGETSVQRIANMVLAMEVAVKRKLSSDLREQFKNLAAKRKREISVIAD